MTNNTTNAPQKLKPSDQILELTKELALYVQNITQGDLAHQLGDALTIHVTKLGTVNWLIGSNRTKEIKDIIGALNNGALKRKAMHKIIVDDILSNHDWSEDSFNSHFIRTLVKTLTEYDHSSPLSLENVLRINSLLPEAIEKRLINDEKISDQEKKLEALRKNYDDVEENLLKKQEKLAITTLKLIEERKQLEDVLKQLEMSHKLLEINNKKLAEYKRALQKSNDEIKQKMASLDKLKNEEKTIAAKISTKEHELRALYPDVDFSILYDPKKVKPATLVLAEKNAVTEFVGTIKAVAENQARQDELALIRQNRDLRQGVVLRPEMLLQTETKIREDQAKELAEIKALRAEIDDDTLKADLQSQLGVIAQKISVNQAKQNSWKDLIKNRQLEKNRKESLIADGGFAKKLDGFDKVVIDEMVSTPTMDDEANDFVEVAKQEKPRKSFKDMKIKTGNNFQQSHMIGLLFRQPEVTPVPASTSTPTPSPTSKMG